jgi:hypothetical protein
MTSQVFTPVDGGTTQTQGEQLLTISSQVAPFHLYLQASHVGGSVVVDVVDGLHCFWQSVSGTGLHGFPLTSVLMPHAPLPWQAVPLISPQYPVLAGGTQEQPLESKVDTAQGELLLQFE